MVLGRAFVDSTGDSSFEHKMKDNSEDPSKNGGNPDSPPHRSVSAPPSLEFNGESLFAFRTDYGGAFADARTSNDYEEFYSNYMNHDKYPEAPPLGVFLEQEVSDGPDPVQKTILTGIVDNGSAAPSPPPMNGANGGRAAWPHQQRKMKNVDNLSLDEPLLHENGYSGLLGDDLTAAMGGMNIGNHQNYAMQRGFATQGDVFAGMGRSIWETPSHSQLGAFVPQPPKPPLHQQQQFHPHHQPGSVHPGRHGMLPHAHPHSQARMSNSMPLPAMPGNIGMMAGMPHGMPNNNSVMMNMKMKHGMGNQMMPQQRHPMMDYPSEYDDHASGMASHACRFYAQGYCSRGDRCSYAHVPLSVNHGMIPQYQGQIPVSAAMDHSGLNGNALIPKVDLGDKLKNQKKRANKSLTNSSPSAVERKQHADAALLGGADPAFRFSSLDQCLGEIYSLCKDQHGCRFLQKKLEEKAPRAVEIIFGEVYEHMVELMTDPFGNYLCQKLLEHCSDTQRLAIVKIVAPALVNISKNMHGTRAVQRMIEFLTTPQQTQYVIEALRNHVVTLIQDLNGNHVIQRCLNRLSSEDNQFVYDAVAANCVEVATHRHGCCVLQRCIDHASDRQKIQLVREVTVNALPLVQDPFGNYVVQYVLDLPYQGVAAALIRKFSGHLVELSTQKFSSNVIEKCLHVADTPTQAWMIDELMEADTLAGLLQDPFANYVIQTCLQVAEPGQRSRLIMAIKPHLPALRNTPYGKRIQNKILKETGHMP